MCGMELATRPRRLGGEPEDAESLEDIELWVGVYAELTSIVRRIAASSQDAALLKRLSELEARQRFWSLRRHEGLSLQQRPVESL